MDKTLYDMIFKRKSFHLFRNIGDERLTETDLNNIEEIYKTLTPLCPDIKTDIRIVPAQSLLSGRGKGYCIMLYSEKKDNYLANIGYIGEQLDLYLVSQNIGTLWYGLGKPDEQTYNDLQYVIMFMIAKVDSEEKFRTDIFKAKRKSVEEVWLGEIIDGVSDIARFAPSACNSQPWRVEKDGNTLTVYRYHKSSMIGIMSPENAKYFNRIDMGIYLCFLELCLQHNGIEFKKELFADKGDNSETTKVAVYKF